MNKAARRTLDGHSMYEVHRRSDGQLGYYIHADGGNISWCKVPASEMEGRGLTPREK